MSFVKFTEVGKNFQPRAMITASGVICFNQGARKKFNMDRWTHCVMYLDPDAHTIGFELVHDENVEGANRFRHIRREGADINARSFLEHFKLRVRRPLSFRLIRDLETEWLMIRLDDAEVVEEEETVLIEKEEEPVKKEPPSSEDVRPEPEKDKEKSPVALVASTQSGPSVVPVGVKKPEEQSSRPLPARSEPHVVPVASGGALTRGRGVKAMISELLQD